MTPTARLIAAKNALFTIQDAPGSLTAEQHAHAIASARQELDDAHRAYVNELRAHDDEHEEAGHRAYLTALHLNSELEDWR